MLSLPSFAVLALAALSPVAAIVVPRTTAPKGWQDGFLEPYDRYHERYLALGCQGKHGKPFFNLCCHPLLASEKIENGPPECIPYDDCDDDDNEHTSTSTHHAHHHASTPAFTPPTSKTAAPTHTSSHHPSPSPSPEPKPSPSPKPTPNAQASPNPEPSPTPQTKDANLITGGFATYFYQGGNAGACGITHSDNDLICAMDTARYGNGELCGKRVKITNPADGKSVIVVVADECPTCQNGDSIDLSLAAFKAIAPFAEGDVPMVWSFV